MIKKILEYIRKYKEWKEDKVIKSEKIFERHKRQDLIGNGVLNYNKEYYIDISLTAYVETHMVKGKVWYKPIKMWTTEGTLPKSHYRYDDIVDEIDGTLIDNFEKVYYEYCNNIK